jgi:hypothetical protein
MTEVKPSPDIFLRKKRSVADDENNFDHISYGDLNSQKKSFHGHLSSSWLEPVHLERSFQSIDAPSSKRIRSSDSQDKNIECAHGIAGLNHAHNLSDSALDSNRSASHVNRAAHVAAMDHAAHERYHECVVSSLKIEHAMVLARKDQQIQQLLQECDVNNSRCKSMVQQHNQCLEDNKLLKKAVAIQDGRYKELASQFNQLQQLAAQAAEHIAQLERTNRAMADQMRLMSYGEGGGGAGAGGGGGFGGFYHGGGPPDVY